MTTQANKQIVQQFYDSLEDEDYVAAENLCHPDFVFYLQLDQPINGVDGFIASEKKNFDAFPGFSFKIEKMIAEDDLVAAYTVFEGTHTGGPAEGIQPTGKKVRFSLFMLLKIADGKIIEKRAHFDRVDIRRQLGQSGQGRT